MLAVLATVTVAPALGEELCWRGYLLPLVQPRTGAAVGSLLAGGVWFLWHLPLRWLPGGANSGIPLPLWGVSIVATAVVCTWL